MIIKEKIISKRNLEVEPVGISEEEFARKLITGKITHENDYFFEIGKDKIVAKIKKDDSYKTQTSYELGD